MSDSAAPSWLPRRGEFFGFLGQISSVEPQRPGLIARAELRAFEAVEPVREFAPLTPLDAIAGHVLSARALAASAPVSGLLGQIDDLLLRVGRELARREASDDGGDRFY